MIPRKWFKSGGCVKKHISRNRLRSLLLLAGLLAFVLFFQLNYGSHFFVRTLLNFGHIPLFGVVSLVLLKLIKEEHRRAPTCANFVAAGLLTLLLGFGVECIQTIIPGKQFETDDLLFDLLGAAGFLSVAFVRSHREIPASARRAVLIGVSLLMLAAFLPVAVSTFDAVRMYRDFPVIASFEKNTELSRWQGNNASIRLAERNPTTGKSCMEVRLDPGEYPGINTRNLVRDWSPYDLLLFDVYLQGDQPLSLTVRIDDKAHNQQFEDRYNVRFLLRPGLNRVKIQLIDLVNAPKGRTMDLKSIVALYIFTFNLQEKRTFCIENILLADEEKGALL